MSELYRASLLLTGGVCLGFALHAVMLAWQTRERRYVGLLGLSLLEAGYCLAAYAYFGEVRPERAIAYGRAICVFTPFITWVFGDLVADMTTGGPGPRWFRLYQRITLGGAAAFAALVVADAYFGTGIVLTGEVVTDPSSRHRHLLMFAPAGEAWLAWVSTAFVVFAVLLARAYRTRRNLLPVVVGSVVYFAATVSDFGILSHLYDAYFVQHVGFFVLVAGCWWILAARYEASLRDVKRALASLEDQRRRLLISAPLVQRNKLDGIGTLAAGVAHEVNNPVHGIMNYAELLKRQITDEVGRGFADEIIEECRRVTAIVKALVSLARADDRQVGGVPVTDVVDDVVRLMRHTVLVGRIRLDVELPPDLPEVFEGAQQMKQVLLNLLTNACDALAIRDQARREEKTIKIVASTSTGDEHGWLVIDTVDNADGIEPALVDRIFDPFFTTKPAGRGAGLGLAISQEIALSRLGRLTCRTTRGAGTTFRLEWPITDRPPLASGEAPRASSAPPKMEAARGG